MKKLITILACLPAAMVCCAGTSSFRVEAARTTGKVSPKLYGLMTEEINHCYDGGLYAELVQNRTLRDDPVSPVHWSVIGDDRCYRQSPVNRSGSS